MSQLLVASGVAATCGLLGVSEWLRERAWRIRASQARVALGRPDGNARGQRSPTYERITSLDELTGYRQAAGGR